MEGRILDISPVISEAIAVWPGDVPYSREITLAIARGDNIDLSAVRTTLHLGAHADAHSHYTAGGVAIGERALEPYVGACQVIEVDVPREERIRPQHLRVPIAAPRVLLRTDSFPDANKFTTDFNSLSPELVDFLHARGVVLVGIDTPSVDPFDDKILGSHQALARHGMANLEGLVLDAIDEGAYELIALPLRIVGGDASPVRAVLRVLSGDTTTLPRG